MNNTLHRVWRVGADIDTDALAPGAYMKFGIDVIAQHCLQDVAPDFSSQVGQGDVLVAGPNFGIGSSREQAAAALVHLGVHAVIAPTFNGLFFRNAFNVGLLLLTCPLAEAIAQDEYVRIDLKANQVIRPNGDALALDPLPEFLLDMVRAGGLLAQLRLQCSRQEVNKLNG